LLGFLVPVILLHTGDFEMLVSREKDSRMNLAILEVKNIVFFFPLFLAQVLNKI
jgi:hypothetical protein